MYIYTQAGNSKPRTPDPPIPHRSYYINYVTPVIIFNY
jgi:hypothetical protein